MRTRGFNKIYHRMIVSEAGEENQPTGLLTGLSPDDPIGKTIKNIEKGIQAKGSGAPVDPTAEAEPSGDSDISYDAPEDAGPENTADEFSDDVGSNDAGSTEPQDPSLEEAPPIDPDAFTIEQLGYFGLLMKGSYDKYPEQLMKMVSLDSALLTPSRIRFIDDNQSLISMTLETPVADFAKKFRSKIKKSDSFTSAWAEMSDVVQGSREISESIFKLGRLGNARSDFARKLIGALCGGAQIGSGGSGPDILIPLQKDGRGIWLSVKSAANWSNIEIATWQLGPNDVQNYLSEVEAQRLQSGSPEERQVIRKRLVIESASNALSSHEMLIIVSRPDGTWEELCFTPGPFLKDAFQQGLITVVEIADPDAGMTVSEDGNVTNTIRFGFAFTSGNKMALSSPEEFMPNEATGEPTNQTPLGINPDDVDAEAGEQAFLEPVEQNTDPGVFIEQKGNKLILNLPDAAVQTLASATGIFYVKRSWNADEMTRQRAYFCVPSARDVLFKRC